MVRQRVSLHLVTLALLLTPSARAAETWPVARGPSREPAPYRYDPRVLASAPKEFVEDAVACILYAGTSHLVEPDGTIETITHEITRLNGRKAVEKLGEFRSIVYNPAYQKLTLNEARIHKADGRVVAITPRDVHLRDVATDFSTYDLDKQLVISFPSLQAGDTIEAKWTVRGKNPEHGGQFFTRYSFGDPLYPVVLDEFRVRMPRGKDLKHASGADPEHRLLAAVAEAPAGARLYHWKAAHCRRTPSDEDLPAKEELRPWVACSTFASWDEVGKWKQRLRADCWTCTEEVRKVVKEVTAGLKTPREKARALTYWLRRNIRYVSSGQRHDYTPHAPARVLANRFGDCKDTSQLLAVMLKEAGVAVELATLGAYDDGQVHADVPSPWGTHAILLATIAGKEHWIDTTARLAGWDFLPRDDCDRLCYLTDSAGHIRLRRTPALTPERNRIEQTTEVWVGSDGASRCRRTVVSYGSAAMAARDALLEVPSGERRRQVAAELQDAHSRARLVSLEVDERALRDLDAPVTARLEFEIPGHFTGNLLREGSFTDSKVWSKLLGHNFDPDRRVPLVLYAPFELVHRYVFHLPPAYALDDLPARRTVRSAWGTFLVKVRALRDGKPSTEDGTLRDVEVAFHTRLDRVRVEPDDLDTFRTFFDEVNRRYRVWLTLRPVGDLADAPPLEALLAFVPQDSTSAAVLARLYKRNGMNAEARRVLRRTLHYCPDAAELWELTVQCADTLAAREEAQRQLVRRYPKEVRHALALGEVLVSRGKQDEARKVLQPLTRRGSPAQRAQAHFELARSHYRKEQLPDALKEMDAAASASAAAVRNLRCCLLRARILEQLGRMEDSAKAYQQALDLERDSEQCLVCLIRLSLLAGKRADTLGYLRRYSLVVCNDVSGLLLAAQTYLKLGCYDDAFELAARARDIRFHEKAQRILGLVYLHRGDYAGAVRHLEKADPDAVVMAALFRAYTQVANLRELERLLEKAERVESPPAPLRRATAAARRLLQRRAELSKLAGKGGDWAGALDAVACAEALHAEGQPAARVEAVLAPALRDGLAVGPALALRGRLALARGKLAKALADAEQAVRLCPRDAGGYYVRGRVRLERNELGALADLEKSAELSGRQDADVLAALADGLARAGRLAEAVAAQRAAVKLRPADRELREQLTALEKAKS
jgi:tetratricopeptide (TPR) repeat protein